MLFFHIKSVRILVTHCVLMIILLVNLIYKIMIKIDYFVVLL